MMWIKILQKCKDRQHLFASIRGISVNPSLTPVTPKKPNKRQHKSSPEFDKESKKVSSQLKEFFKDNPRFEQIQAKVPIKYLVKHKNSAECLCLLDEETAKSIASHIVPCIKRNKIRFFCETNARMGLISEAILDSQIRHPFVLHLYETNAEYREVLQRLVERHVDHVKLFGKNLLSYYAYLKFLNYKDLDLEALQELIPNSLQRSWSDDPGIVVIDTTSDYQLIKHLTKAIAYQTDIISYGRLQLFTVMSSSVYKLLTSRLEDSFRGSKFWNVLFNLFFDYTLLETYPRKYCLPWSSKNMSQLESENVYLVKIDMKKQLPVRTEELVQLFQFTRIAFTRISTPIIPLVERLVPDIGIHVIAPSLNHEEYFNAITICTRFDELTPQEILSIFREIAYQVDWEFFKHILEAAYIRKRKTADDDDDK